MKRFSQQKYDWEEETGIPAQEIDRGGGDQRAHADKRKQENLDRKQESGEDTKKYYAAKEELWLQVYAANKRSLVEFKDEMLKGTV